MKTNIELENELLDVKKQLIRSKITASKLRIENTNLLNKKYEVDIKLLVARQDNSKFLQTEREKALSILETELNKLLTKPIIIESLDLQDNNPVTVTKYYNGELVQ